MNGGICLNLDNGQGFQCICQEGFSGDLCDAVHQEKVMRLSTAALAAIVICLVNIISEFLETRDERKDFEIIYKFDKSTELGFSVII